LFYERCRRFHPWDVYIKDLENVKENPINPAEAVLGGFLDRVMSAEKDRGLEVIAMKGFRRLALHLPGKFSGTQWLH
jgi:hypothetical protein